MRQFRFGLAVLISVVLAGCGGGGGSDQSPKPVFTSLVTFGDSLSDVGTYKVGAVAASGGGQFTVNSATATTNWTQFLAPQLGLTGSNADCPYETGLDDGSAGASTTGTYVPVVTNTNCTNYAQGGARVTSQPGIGNHLLGGGGFALTVPVVTQIANHLAAHTSFSAKDLVVVMAGANDIFFQAGLVGASYPPASAVAAVSTAAAELANDVNTQIIAKGATHVVVMNVPDIGSTPYGMSLAASGGQTLLNTLVTAFNTQLKASLPDSASVLNVDAYTASHDEVANPALYGLSNATTPACNLTLTNNTSLFCSAATLNTGVNNYYLFADAVHPTPYGHALFSIYVLQAMTNKGWY